MSNGSTMSNGFTKEQVEPVTMKDQVAGLIKKAMMSGRLQPGERIVELQLAKQLGVGTTCVREALFDLERQGFVNRVANKGAYVTEFNLEDTEQIYKVRTALEGLAVELAQGQTTEEEFDSLQAFIDEMRAAGREGDLVRFFDADLSFHRGLWALSRNRYLVRLLESIVVPLFAFYIMRTRRDVEQLLHGADNHQRILDIIKSGDMAGARRTVEDTLRRFKGEEPVFLNLPQKVVIPADR